MRATVILALVASLVPWMGLAVSGAGDLLRSNGELAGVERAGSNLSAHRDHHRTDGAELIYDPTGRASAQNPAFSPDGQTLLFTLFHTGYNDGPAGLYVIPMTGGDPVVLIDEEGHDSVNLPGSSWNAATNRITFASDRQDIDEIWTMAPDGGGLFRVTHHTTPGYFIEPSFSPDGEWIVFEADTDAPDEEQRASIWKVRADGTELTQLTDGPRSSTDDRQPNWSPTGDRILFQRRSLGSDDWNLYTMSPDGSDIRPVTTAPSSDTDASWSPDGRWIVYSSDHGGLPVPNLFIIPAEGGTPIRVTRDRTREDGAPSWSPDGEWIAFESHRGQDEDTPASLWRIAAPDVLDGQPPRLQSVNDFLYQLQNLDLRAIGDTAYDLVVMDYSADGSEAGEFTAAEIEALRHSPGGEKIVLAYMSIGEAEDYRFYWRWWWRPSHPSWLDVENPDWPGNYKVHYWDPRWQAIILEYTDRLIDAGFDGAYLDLIDAYQYYADRGRTTAAEEMVAFVRTIAAHARARDPDFLIIPQNAPELATSFPTYLEIVDGIGQEEVYYGYEEDDQPTPPNITAELEAYLDVIKEAGKLVLTIDYATTPAHIDDAYARSRAKGYVPFVTVRELDRLTINPGHEPD
ncbi:MAG: hypothetical protein D6723_03625 [Acidobacteria bacterium]|nr:MAG: hypothetical protein D6723_03625 [Acidobacteriota bacterium]